MIPALRLQTETTAEPIDTLGVVLLVAFVLAVTLAAIIFLRPSWTLPDDPRQSGERDREDEQFEPQFERSGGLDWRRDDPTTRQTGTGAISTTFPTRMMSEEQGQRHVQLPVWLAETGAAQTIAAFSEISLVISRLADAASRGDLAAGFALYTPHFRERFRGSTGLDSASFARWLASGVTPPDQPIAVRSITEIDSRPDGALQATVTYEPTTSPRPAERFTFVQDPANGWLIDDITALES